MVLTKHYNNMSEQTYLSLHTKSHVRLSQGEVDKVFKQLNVISPVKIYRLLEGDNGWEVFLDPWVDSPEDDILVGEGSAI